DGADRGARVLRGRLLLDRDRRRETLDRIDVRLARELEELARVGGETLDVAALALGVDGVEGERGLAGAGQPGDDDEAVPRQLDVDVLEVVLARAANDDGLHQGRLYRKAGTGRARFARGRHASREADRGRRSERGARRVLRGKIQAGNRRGRVL